MSGNSTRNSVPRFVGATTVLSIALLSMLLASGATAAGASEVDPNTEAGALITECQANDGTLTVFGQVWDDADGDDRLLEDAGVTGVVVSLELESIAPTQTDESGFFAFCINNMDLVELPAVLTVEIPDSYQAVVPGIGDEDEDSDVIVVNPGSATTSEFTLAGELDGRNRQFEADLERLSVRIDAGITEAETLNPCPDWSPDLLELDPDGDWDEDGIVNAADSLPCDRGIANPCPEWSNSDREADTDGDWDGDGIVNAADGAPCESEDPPTTSPCDNPSAAEISQLATLNPAEDWDADGLVNGVDPTPCVGGVGNPCPDWQSIHTEEDAGGDWDGDGLVNIDDALPCDSEPFNPCPEWNREIAEQFGEADWDADGITNAEDPLPCDGLGEDPCPEISDLWIAQDPGGDWDGDGFANAEDPSPCETEAAVNPCPAWTEGLVESDPLSDWDGDSILNIEDEEPCRDVDAIDPCPDWTAELVEQNPLGDWDEDGIFNIEDPEPCDVGEGAEDDDDEIVATEDEDDAKEDDDDDPDESGGFPWSPWGPGVVVCVFGVVGIAAVLSSKKDSDGPEEDVRDPKKPTARIKNIDVS